MAVIETWLRQDLKGLVTVRSLQGQVFSLDNGGNLIGVKVTKDYKPVTLTGTVTGYCILSDGQTVTVTGNGSSGIQNGNEAYIVLPQLVYSVPGQISIVIKLTSGSVTTTLAACTGYVYRSRTSNEVVPPGTPIPDLATMEEVIQRATAATESANTAATGAEKVDASMTKEGDVITISVTDRDGNVMTETMTDTASDVSELKSAFEQLDDNVITESAGPAPIVSIADGADGMPMRKVEVAIEPVQDLHGYEYPWPAGGGACVLRQFEEAPSIEGLTITVSDGKITIDGTVTDTTTINAPITNWQWDGTSDYWLSGCPTGGDSRNGYSLRVSGDGAGSYSMYDIGNGIRLADSTGISIAGMNLKFTIVLRSGTYTNLTFAPMLNAGLSAQPYSPYSNVCPISGWTGAKVTRTGKNLWGGEAVKNALLTIRNASIGSDADGGYVSFFAGNTANDQLFTSFKSDTQYTVVIRYKKNNTSTVSNMHIMYTDGTKQNIIASDTYEEGKLYTAITTSRVGKTISHIESVYGSGTTSVYYDNCGLFEGVITEDQFVPYQGQTYEVTFPADPGTVYGGMLDVVSGKLVVDRAIKDLGAQSWQRTAVSYGYYFVATISDNRKANGDIVCSAYKFVGYGAAALVTQNCTISRSATNKNVFVRDDSYSTAEDFKAAVSGVQLCHYLEEPISIQLDPVVVLSLLGKNNIFADAGNTSITYPADTKTYIDNRINSTRKLIAGIETGFVASKAYAVGDMLIIGDDLYKVASSIASGATITVGTNVTKTTVAEQLLALANA